MLEEERKKIYNKLEIQKYWIDTAFSMKHYELEKVITVTKPSMPSFEEYCNEIRSLWETRWLTNMGPKHETFREQLIKFFECPYINLYANGHLALENAIAVFNFPRGSEIITTPYTFVSTTHAIVRSGMIPVFCDINEDDYTIDVSKIESLITEKTVAILPVHVYGHVCNVEVIDQIAKQHNLKVIYDAAHAFGVKYKGKPIANYGDVSVFSFHATKVFNTAEGGAVCFSDSTLQVPLYENKNFGIHGLDSCDAVGGNAKMNELQAAMGICNLRHFEDDVAKRKKISDCYDNLLKDITGIKLPPNQSMVESNYAYYPVIFDGDAYSRDDVYENLLNNGIFARKYFYPITCKMECYVDMYGDYNVPVSENISNKVLTLPIYPDLRIIDVEAICDTIVRWLH